MKKATLILVPAALATLILGGTSATPEAAPGCRHRSGGEHQHREAVREDRDPTERRRAEESHPHETASRMRAADSELLNLAREIKDTADPDRKIRIMENLLAKLVEERSAMHERMALMMERMATNDPGGESDMSHCPMMGAHAAPPEAAGAEGHPHQH